MGFGEVLVFGWGHSTSVTIQHKLLPDSKMKLNNLEILEPLHIILAIETLIFGATLAICH